MLFKALHKFLFTLSVFSFLLGAVSIIVASFIDDIYKTSITPDVIDFGSLIC